jgi:hypothetical protein
MRSCCRAGRTREVVGIFKQHHAFDAQGIFIGDASYLFVPDNDRYEGSSPILCL